jgi:hypothetical protein
VEVQVGKTKTRDWYWKGTGIHLARTMLFQRQEVSTVEVGKKKLVALDPPSCSFLFNNIKDERKAIESYIKESARTDDQVLKVAFHSVAVDEMKHLQLLDEIKRKLGC